ncbi:MAG TPA: hypothetical protein VJR46_12725 [Candidatus Dormibacteraeota bacterium]|nr:hypothetical protein [Candidatus Dormibacteraeota bacterium]
MGWVAAALWLAFVVLIVVASWGGFDWGGRSVAAFVLLVSAGFVFAIVRRWRSLSIYADEEEVRFGVRRIRRADIASMAMEPPGDTPVRFWAGVGVMAVTQDVSRSVNFRSADGRSLLRTTDLYGRDQLRELARFMDVPLEGY